MSVEATSALLKVSQAALRGVPWDYLVHGALEHLRHVTSCDVAAFYAASNADAALTLQERIRREAGIEALPATDRLLRHVAGDGADLQHRDRALPARRRRRRDVDPKSRHGDVRGQVQRTGDDVLLRARDAERGRSSSALGRQAAPSDGDARIDAAYQPIYDVSGALRSCEALVRWPQADGTVVEPQAFMPYAEAAGLSVPIGAWAIRSVCLQAAAWCRESRAIRVGISISLEFAEQRAILAELRCDALQGGLFARPMSAERFGDLLRVDALPSDRARPAKRLLQPAV